MTQATTTAGSGVRNKAIERYLFTYNVLSSLGWGYALGGTLAHLYREYHKSNEPSTLTKLRDAGRSVYASGMGRFVLALEGMAVQEIIQARKGWVMTSASTVASQVFARLFVLLYIVQRSAAVSSLGPTGYRLTITRLSRLTLTKQNPAGSALSWICSACLCVGTRRMYPLPVLCPSLLERGQGANHDDRASHGPLSIPSLHNIHPSVSFGSRWRRAYPLQEETAVLGSAQGCFDS
jgi:hypothetical protein